MIVGIRDGTLMAGQYASIAEGLRALELSSVELTYNRDNSVPSLARGEERLTLDSAGGRQRLTEESQSSGVQISGLMLANNFNAADLDAEIAWVCGAIRAAEALRIPVLRIDSIMKGEAEIPLEQRVERFTQCLGRTL